MLGKKDKARYEVSSPRWGTTTPYRVLKMGKTSDSEIPCTQRTKINAKSGHENSNTSRNPSHWKTSAMKINLALVSFT